MKGAKNMPEDTKKYENHTKEEIEKYLEEVKKCVIKGNFIIPNTDNRKENQEFIKKYKLTSKKQKEMILKIDALDFCYSVDNYKDVSERLYVFAKEYELDNWGIKNKVLVYIKTVLKDNNFVVVISFHEPNKKIKRLFI